MNEVYILMIWKRDSALTFEDPDMIITARNKDKIYNKLIDYLNYPLSREMDDIYDEERSEKIKQIIKDLKSKDSSTPEMESCYELKLYTSTLE